MNNGLEFSKYGIVGAALPLHRYLMDRRLVVVPVSQCDAVGPDNSQELDSNVIVQLCSVAVKLKLEHSVLIVICQASTIHAFQYQLGTLTFISQSFLVFINKDKKCLQMVDIYILFIYFNYPFFFTRKLSTSNIE